LVRNVFFLIISHPWAIDLPYVLSIFEISCKLQLDLVPVVDAKYVPRTIIHRDYTNVGHYAAQHQELFTVYITSYAHHPQAFVAHCGASLIDTMKGRDVMFKFFDE